MADQDFNIKVVTTADTSGIRQTSAELDNLNRKTAAAPQTGVEKWIAAQKAAKAEAAAAPVAEAGGGGTFGIAVSTAVSAGLALQKAMLAYGDYQVRINHELDVQLTKLTELAQKWADIGKGAQEPGDVGKLVDAMVPALEEATKKAREFQNQGQSNIQAYVNTLSHLPGAAGIAFTQLGAIMQKFHDDEQKRLYDNVEAIRAEALGQARAADETANAYQAQKLKPYSEALADITKQLEYHTELRDKLLKSGDVQGYAAEAKNVQKYEDQLKSLSAVEQQRETEHRLLFPELDQQLYKIKQLEEALKAMGVSTQNLSAAFNQGLATPGPRGPQIQRMVAELQQARNEVSSRLQSDITKGPFDMVKGVQDRQFEFNKKIAAQKELHAEGLGEEVSEGEKIQFQKEEELRALQRKQALQRSLIRPGADQGDIIKDLGKQGAKEFEERAQRIQQLNKELGTRPQQKEKESTQDPAFWLQKLYTLWQ